MTVRQATIADLEYLCMEAGRFFCESNFLRCMTFSPDNTVYSMAAMIESDEHEVLIIQHEGVDCGFAIWGYDKAWTVERIAIEILFYISPAYRRDGVAKRLLQESVNVCDNAGVKLMYSTSTAGFDDNGVNARAYNMLFKSCGFNEMKNSAFLVRTM